MAGPWEGGSVWGAVRRGERVWLAFAKAGRTLRPLELATGGLGPAPAHVDPLSSVAVGAAELDDGFAVGFGEHRRALASGRARCARAGSTRPVWSWRSCPHAPGATPVPASSDASPISSAPTTRSCVRCSSRWRDPRARPGPCGGTRAFGPTRTRRTWSSPTSAPRTPSLWAPSPTSWSASSATSGARVGLELLEARAGGDTLLARADLERLLELPAAPWTATPWHEEVTPMAHLARGRLAALEGQVERASEHAFAACGRSSAPELVLDRLERLAPGLDLAPLREACRTSP